MNKNIFVFLLCFFIILAGFSTQYYLNNKGYHDWVNRYFVSNLTINLSELVNNTAQGIPSPQDIINSLSLKNEINESRVKEIIEQDKNNMKYQDILKILIAVSLFMIIVSIAFILANIGEFPNRKIFKPKPISSEMGGIQ